MFYDFSLVCWLSNDRFSYSKTFPAKSSGTPLTLMDAGSWQTESHSITVFNTWHSTAALREEWVHYKDSPAHTASSCYLPCTWLMHRIKPSAAYQVYFKFSSSLSYSIKFLYWGLTLLNYVKKQLYVLYSSEGHSTRMRWSDKTSDTEGWLQIHSVQSHRTVYHCCKSTVKSIVPLLPTSTYFMCNKIL